MAGLLNIHRAGSHFSGKTILNPLHKSLYLSKAMPLKCSHQNQPQKQAY